MNKNHIITLFHILLCTLIFVSCEDKEIETIADGRVNTTTLGITDISMSTAVGQGEAKLEGKSLPANYFVVGKGLIFGTEPSNLEIASHDYDYEGYNTYFGCIQRYSYDAVSNNATVVNIGFTQKDDTKEYKELEGEGAFNCYLTNLDPGTNYYVRAFTHISNDYGDNNKDYSGTFNTYLYGEQLSFTTSAAPPALPDVTTNAATNITGNSATLGGNITFVGNPKYTSKGICYSTSQNPTINDSQITVTGNGTGPFTGKVSDLSMNTTYYAKAYATNLQGTAYGNQVSFKTENFIEKLYTLDDGSAEVGWRQNPEYGNSYGNKFTVGEAGELTSIDVYGKNYEDDAGSRTVTIDIYNASLTLVGSSSAFVLPRNQWQNVPLNNKIPYSGTFYVMVRWSATSGETNYLGLDLNGSNATERLGYYIQNGNWYVFEDRFEYGSDNYYDAIGVWLIRAHANASGRSVSYGTEIPPATPTKQTTSETLKSSTVLHLK